MVSEEEGMEEGHLPTPHPLTTKAPIEQKETHMLETPIFLFEEEGVCMCVCVCWE